MVKHWKNNKKLAQESESPFHAYLLLGNTSSHLLKQRRYLHQKYCLALKKKLNIDIKLVSSENLNTLGVEDIKILLKMMA